jgi:hypothetical protein
MNELSKIDFPGSAISIPARDENPILISVKPTGRRTGYQDWDVRCCMNSRRSHARVLSRAGALATAVLLLSPAGANAAPKRLECTLTNIEKKVNSKSDFEPENRSISVVFDGQAKQLTVYQDGNALTLNNVTATVTSINGYADKISVGINSADWNIVFQTYESDSTRAEFGVCSPNAQVLP